MASLFDKPSPGDKFKPNAGFQGLLVDMVNWWMTQAQSGIQTITGPEIAIRNQDDASLNQFSIVRLGDIVLDPAVSETGFRNDLVFDAAAPAADQIFAITQEPIAPDSVGEAKIAGFSRVKVSFTNANHKFAAPTNNNYDYLVSQASDGPAAVIWKEAGVGTKWAVVSLNVSSTPGLGATTVLCIPDCGGTEYCIQLPQAWLTPKQDTCGDEENPPGGESACTYCENQLNQMCIVFPGVHGICGGCEIFGLPITLVKQEVATGCYWTYDGDFLDCPNELIGSLVRVQLFGSAADAWTLQIDVPFGSGGYLDSLVLVYYQSTDTWDCSSPLTLTLSSTPSDACSDWPATVIVQPCGEENLPPTVNFNSSDQCDDDTTLTITGTGFVSPASNNILDFSSGTATCTSVTGSTSLVATFSELPLAGALSCIVRNENGTSILPMQVATVISCGETLWEDSFTEGAPPVLLTAHTGETTPGGYTNLNGQMACNSSGKAVNSSADDDFGFVFDPGATAYELTFKFKVAPTSQDIGERSMLAYVRYLDVNNCFRVGLHYSAMDDTATSFDLNFIQAGLVVDSEIGITTTSTDTEYTCTVNVSSSSVSATINGVTATLNSTALGAYTKMALAFKATMSSSTKPYFDDVTVTN